MTFVKFLTAKQFTLNDGSLNIFAIRVPFIGYIVLPGYIVYIFKK